MAFARLTPELRLAPPAKPAWSKIVFVPTGRRLSAIVRRQSNVGGPPVYLQLHSSFARLTPELRLAPPTKPAWSKIVFVPTGRRLSAIVRRQSNVGGPPVYLQLHS